MDFSFLPTLNAFLNFTSFVLLILGFREIKKGNREKHKRYMLSATCVSVAFLISYLTYHYNVGSVKFQGVGFIRYVYFFFLIPHTIFAAINLPMVIITLTRALKGNFSAHKKIAKKTLWIWLYVSFTGVIVYVMLYHLF